MNTLNTQYTETDENGIKTISIKNVNFIHTNLLTSEIGNAYKLINGDRNTEKFSFDGNREFYRFGGNYFIIKYSDKELRDNDKKVLTREGKFNKFGKAKKDEEGFQIPKTDFVVDFEGNYYLLIKGTLLLDEDLTDLNKGVFKSMIIDFNKFNGIGSEAEVQVKKVENYVDGLLNI